MRYLDKDYEFHLTIVTNATGTRSKSYYPLAWIQHKSYFKLFHDDISTLVAPVIRKKIVQYKISYSEIINPMIINPMIINRKENITWCVNYLNL